MVWYANAVEAVDIADRATSETDRMWRQIDPVVDASVERVLDGMNNNHEPATSD